MYCIRPSTPKANEPNPSPAELRDALPYSLSRPLSHALASAPRHTWLLPPPHFPLWRPQTSDPGVQAARSAGTGVQAVERVRWGYWGPATRGVR